MLRITGVLFLSLVPILFGFYRSGSLLEEGRIKERIIRFFEHVQFEIEAFSTPLEQIVFRFEDRYLEKNRFLPVLREELKKNPCGALERAVTFLLDAVPFSEKEAQTLKEFGENFGMQSKKMQLKDCEKLILTLKTEEELRGEKRIASASVARATGICTGLGLLILLI